MPDAENLKKELAKEELFCNFLHLKEVNRSLFKSLKDEMYENHPEYKINRINNFNKRKQRNHEHSSSDSSLDRYDNYTRKKIIKRGNEDFQVEKKIEEKKRKWLKLKLI